MALTTPSTPFTAPCWARCCGCFVGIVPFAAHSTMIALGRASVPVTVALPVSAYVFLCSLHALISGRPSRSMWRLALDEIPRWAAV
jgi:hypothetical protein